METMTNPNGNTIASGGAAAGGSGSGRDFESEIRTHLIGLADLMNESVKAGETYGFSIGTKPDGTFFLENLTVTRQLIRKPTN